MHFKLKFETLKFFKVYVNYLSQFEKNVCQNIENMKLLFIFFKLNYGFKFSIISAKNNSFTESTRFSQSLFASERHSFICTMY